MRGNSMSGRRAVVAVAAASLAVCASAAVPASAAAPAATSSSHMTARDLPPIDPLPVTDPVLPIFAAVGKGLPVAGATVQVRSGGQVVATGTTGPGGVALIKRADLPEHFTVRISGGTVNGEASDAVLLSTFDPEAGQATADLVTTLIEKYKQKTGTPGWTANWMTMHTLGLMTGVDTVNSRFSTDKYFDGHKFLTIAARNGGVSKYMSFLIPKIKNGKKITFRGNAQNRSTASDLLNDATGDLGNYLGLPNPGADIQAKAQQAAQAMQQAMTDLMKMQWYTTILVQQSIYTTETSKVSMVESGTKYINDRWSTFANTSPTTAGYDTLRTQMVNDINTKVYMYYQQYESLFPGSTAGVLKAGHNVFQQMYGYYLSGDVTQIQGMVSYWETLAAGSNLYIVNMYSYNPSQAALIPGQNTMAQQWDARILKAMPDSLGSSELGVWKQNRAYLKAGSTWMDYKVITNMASSWGDCGNYSGGYSKAGSPTYISSTDLNNKYKAMVPGGYNWAATSDSQYFTATRSGGSGFLDVVHSQDTGIAFLVYTDTNMILGQEHTYKDTWGNTHHDWKGETVCSATYVQGGGTTVNNENNWQGGGFWTSAMVYRDVTLAPPATF